MSLYARLLGGAWEELPARLRALYGAGDHRASARGRFHVERGDSWLARAVASVARLPKAGDGVPTEVTIEPTPGGGVRWSRRFDDRVLVTTQTAQGGDLVERVGPLEYRFRLRVEAGALVFDQAGVALALGPLRAPLPRALWGRVTGKAFEDGGRIRTQVSIGVPFLGDLVRYDGALDGVDARTGAGD